jgi:hypothetical protein
MNYLLGRFSNAFRQGSFLFSEPVIKIKRSLCPVSKIYKLSPFKTRVTKFGLLNAESQMGPLEKGRPGSGPRQPGY